MNALEFLEAVWPADGYYCIALPYKTGYAHYVFDNISDAAAFVERKKDTDNVFFSVHSLKEKQVWNPNKKDWKTGELGAFEKRVQSNMQEARAFFFDLDVDGAGENPKKYASQYEAMTGLIQFCKDAQLPRPMVTSSGGGLHVYWLLEDSMLSDQWRVQAARLKQLADHYKLKVDPARTTDTASVLRVAGTYNLKTDTKRPVVVKATGVVTPNDAFIKILTDAVTATGMKLTTMSAARSIPASWGSNLIVDQSNLPAPTMGAVLKACPLFQYYARNPEKMSESEWYQSLNVVRFTDKGEANAHKWSQKDPARYDYDATQTKLDNQKSRIDPTTNKPMGVTKCTTFAALSGSEYCNNCIFSRMENVKTPIGAATYKSDAPPPIIEMPIGDQIQTIEIPPPPFPYQRLAEGKIVMTTKDKEGEEVIVEVLRHDLHPLWRMRNSITNVEELYWRAYPGKDGIVDFPLSPEALYDDRKLTVSLSNMGIYPSVANLKYLRFYMVAYIQHLQSLSKSDEQRQHLGWVDDLSGFVLPDKMYVAGGIEPVRLSRSAINGSSPIKKKGTLEKQVELLNIYNRPDRIAHQFFILAGLGSIGLRATDQHGVIINASGQSGASKSTTLYAAASLWGEPKTYTIDGTYRGMTLNALNERVGILGNLPVCVDEITKMQQKDMVNLVMGVSQPQPKKIRCNNSGELREIPTNIRSTMMLTTANVSLHAVLSGDDASGTAGSMRVLEIMLPKIPHYEKSIGDQFLYGLRENYGHIGEVVVQYVTDHREEVDIRIRKKMEQIDAEGRIQGDERFWSAAAAPTIVKGEIARELGVLNFDMAAIQHWFIHVQLPYMRGVVVEEYVTPIGVVTNYLEHINSNILVTKKSSFGSGATIERHPQGSLLARYDMSDNILWVLKKNFKDYCVKTGANGKQLLDTLFEPTILPGVASRRIVTSLSVRKVLGAGTDYAKAQAECFTLDMNHPELSGVLPTDLIQNPSAVVTPPRGDFKIIKP